MDAKLDAELTVLARKVALRLCDMRHGRGSLTRMIFPSRRDGWVRVSEQESKIQFCRLLDESGWYYAVETPTRETYRQSGSYALSGRIDISLFEGPSMASRSVNIELKAHTPKYENFRKDVEKLVREQLPGVWFHTLERGTAEDVATVREYLAVAVRRTAAAREGPYRRILVFVCRLSDGLIIEDVIELGSGIRAADGRVRPAPSAAMPEETSRDILPARVFVRFLDILGGQWLLLNRARNSYRLRHPSRPDWLPGFYLPDAPAYRALMEKYPVHGFEPLSADDRKHSVQDAEYWKQRFDSLGELRP